MMGVTVFAAGLMMLTETPQKRVQLCPAAQYTVTTIALLVNK